MVTEYLRVCARCPFDAGRISSVFFVAACMCCFTEMTRRVSERALTAEETLERTGFHRSFILCCFTETTNRRQPILLNDKRKLVIEAK